MAIDEKKTTWPHKIPRQIKLTTRIENHDIINWLTRDTSIKSTGHGRRNSRRIKRETATREIYINGQFRFVSTRRWFNLGISLKIS